MYWSCFFISFDMWVVRTSDLTSDGVFYLQYAKCRLGNQYMNFGFPSVLAKTTLKYSGGKFWTLIFLVMLSFFVCHIPKIPYKMTQQRVLYTKSFSHSVLSTLWLYCLMIYLSNTIQLKLKLLRGPVVRLFLLCQILK